jgi:hypothetical protein
VKNDYRTEQEARALNELEEPLKNIYNQITKTVIRNEIYSI